MQSSKVPLPVVEAAPAPSQRAPAALHRLPGLVASDGTDVGYRFVLLVVIVNFPVVRRRAGLARGERLMACIATHLEQVVEDADIAVVGSSTIEIGFDAAGFAAGRACLDCLHAALSHPVDFDGEHHVVRAAIGGAGGPQADVAEIDLIEAAERALHDARLRGGDRLDDLGDPRFAIDPMDLMRDLPAAIANGEIFLQYQPKLHVRRQCVASAEALVRWRHPTRGLIFPGSFIEMAERCLEIAGLTLWTLRQAVADQRALATEGHDFPLFVNISGVLLSDEAFVAEACTLVGESGAQIEYVLRDALRKAGRLPKPQGEKEQSEN